MAGQSRAGRAFAAGVAAVAIAGLVIQFRATLAITDAVGGAVWVLLRYFTIMANVLVAVVMVRRAFSVDPPRHAWLLGGVVVIIGLVGVVYTLLLRGLLELSGGAALANLLLHYVTPVLAPLYWLLFAPKGGLRYRDTAAWCALPVGYLIYALVRGELEGHYAYPFLNLAKLGAGRVATICAVIAVGFLASGCTFVWLDGWLGRRGGR